MRSTYIATILLVLIVIPGNHLLAQNLEAKRDIYNRGLEQLRALKKPDRFQLNNAFASAAAIDSHRLVESLINEFEFAPTDVVENALVNQHNFENFELAFRHLQPDNLSMDHFNLIAVFANALGQRKGNLDRLLESLDSFLKNQAPDEDTLEGVEPEQLHKRRISEIRYFFQLGFLRHNKVSISLADVQRGIEPLPLRERLHAIWLTTPGQNRMTADEIIASVSHLESARFAKGAMRQFLEQMEPEKIASDDGRKLVRHLVEQHTRHQEQLRDEVEFEFEFYLIEEDIFSTNSLSATDRMRAVAQLAIQSKLADTDPKIFENDIPLLNALESARSANLERSKPKAKPKTPHEHKFEEKLAGVPWEKQPSWIINFVLIYGWQNHSVEPGQIPAEDVILKAFDTCKDDDPGAARQVARSINSFTPPTPAARAMLMKMMQLYPEDQQIITKYEVDVLSEKIRSANESTLNDLIAESFDLLKKSRKSKDDFAAHFAFEYALMGNKKAMNKMLDQIAKPEDKVWALFQCSAAYPPHSLPEKQIWFSRRKAGGVF